MYQRRLLLTSPLLMVLYTEISELFCTSFRLAFGQKNPLKDSYCPPNCIFTSSQVLCIWTVQNWKTNSWWELTSSSSLRPPPLFLFLLLLFLLLLLLPPPPPPTPPPCCPLCHTFWCRLWQTSVLTFSFAQCTARHYQANAFSASRGTPSQPSEFERCTYEVSWFLCLV